jgi:hypothetical protein
VTDDNDPRRPPRAVDNRDLWIELRKVQDQIMLMTPQAMVIQDHEQRIRSIERWKYALPTSLVLAVASAVGTVLGLKG